MVKLFTAMLVGAALAFGPAHAQSRAPQPAENFVDRASALSATISPGGAFVAYIARDDSGTQIVVVDLANLDARVIQRFEEHVGSFQWVSWKSDERLIIGLNAHEEIRGRAPTGTMMRERDIEFDILRVFAINRDGSSPVQLFEEQMTQLSYGYGSTWLVDALRSDPEHVLVAAQDNEGTSVWRGNINSGRAERVVVGNDETMDYVTDGSGAVVVRVDGLADQSGYRFYRRAPTGEEWILYREVRRGDATTNSPDFQTLAAGPKAGEVYVLVRHDDADLLRLFVLDTSTGELRSPLSDTSVADASGAWVSPQTHEILATCEFGMRYECKGLNPLIQRNFAALGQFFGSAAQINLVDMSDDASHWLLSVDGPTLPEGYYLYDLDTHRVSPIASAFPNVDPEGLSPTEVMHYAARDGFRLWAYVTARPGVAGPRPTVVMPHGGPESRDHYGYDAFVQFLASRGYVVVQPNFRGGVGFGRAFADAGRGQWGLRMQDDVTDAVKHLVDTGIVDPNRICIVGASYGGYAALEGAASTPDLYKCAVSISGISDLLEQVRAEARGEEGRRDYSYRYWVRSIGDPAANHEGLLATSPRFHADRIKADILLIHGDDDETVPFHQSELMQQALREAGRETRLIKLPSEDHYWDHWSREHRLTVFRETEAFLARHLSH